MYQVLRQMEQSKEYKRSCLISPLRVLSLFSSYIKKELKGKGITFGDWVCILFIGDEKGCSIKNICYGLSLDKGQATRQVKKLIQTSFIENKSDARTYSLYLTEKGLMAYAYCDLLFNKVMEIMFEDMSEEEIDTTKTVSKRLNQKLEKYYEY